MVNRVVTIDDSSTDLRACQCAPRHDGQSLTIHGYGLPLYLLTKQLLLGGIYIESEGKHQRRYN